MHAHQNVPLLSATLILYDQVTLMTEICPPRECELPDDPELAHCLFDARENLRVSGVDIEHTTPQLPLEVDYTHVRHNCSVPDCQLGSHRYFLTWSIWKEPTTTQTVEIFRHDGHHGPLITARGADIRARLLSVQMDDPQN